MKRLREGKEHAKERILQAAERLSARGGIAGLSSREVTAEAGMSVAMVNYHFGSRSGLVAAVLQARLADLDGMRLQRLEALPAQASVRDVVGAFVEATLGFSDRAGHGVADLLHATGSEPAKILAQMRQCVLGANGSISRRILGALSAALVGVPDELLQWRWRLAVAVIGEALIADENGGTRWSTEFAGQLTDMVVSLLTAGLTHTADRSGVQAPMLSSADAGGKPSVRQPGQAARALLDPLHLCGGDSC